MTMAPSNVGLSDLRPEEKQAEQGRRFSLLSAVVFMMLGGSIGPGIFVLLREVDHVGNSLLAAALGFLIAIGLALVVTALAAFVLIPRMIGNVQGTLDRIVTQIAVAGSAYASGKNEDCIAHLGKAATEASAWYANMRIRQFISQASIGLLIAFGGVVGAALLITQNALLRDQNIKIDQQNITSEAQRRGALTAELFDILKSVAEQREVKKITALSPGLASRIVVFTRSAQPHLYVRYATVASGGTQATVIARPLSPERGQLLIGLLANDIDVQLLALEGATFESSDLRYANLGKGFDLNDVNLSHSDFSGATVRVGFAHSNLEGAIFDDATLVGSNFDQTRMTGASLKSAIITNTKFSQADGIEAVDFSDAVVAIKENSEPPPQGLKLDGYTQYDDGGRTRLRKK